MNFTETETLKEVYGAINRDDIAAALAFFDPQVERIEPMASRPPGSTADTPK